MNILVTGGAGLIGSNLTKKLCKEGHQVKVIDNLWRGKLENLADESGHYCIDIEKCFFNHDLSISLPLSLLDGVDVVYHLADVVAGINYVFNNQGSLFRANLLINSNVLSAVRQSNVKSFVYVGTACSFPAHLQNTDACYALKEEDQYPAEPESAYGWSKLMGEYETFLLEKETNIKVSVLSLHNVYGAPSDLDDLKSQVIPSLIKKAILYPDVPFRVWGSGYQSRAFVHVNDVVDALVLTLDKGLGHGVIQIGPSNATTIRELAETIVSISGKNIKVEYDTDRFEGDRSRCADYSKAKRVLGWQPKVTLYAGLSSLYEWAERTL